MTDIDCFSLEELLTALDQHIVAEVSSRLEQFAIREAEQDAKIAELQGIIDGWVRLPHVVGMFPDPYEIEQMQVQIFQREAISTQQRMAGHTEWSLGVEYWSGGKRFPKINIALMGPTKFIRAVKNLKDASAKMRRYATARIDDTVAGIIRRKLPGGGRGYVVNQFALLFERTTSDPTVVLFIGDMNFVFGKFQPGKGTKEGKAKWFSSDFSIDTE